MSHPGIVAFGLVVGVFVVLGTIGHHQRKKAVARLLLRRANPTYEAFCAAMPDVTGDITAWLWEALQVYCKPELTPHPDDDIVMDLRIDPDDANDWLRDFCQREGLDYRAFPDWPKDQPTTVGNFARWLATGRAALTQTASG